jgi:hypothetical protein
MISSCEIWLIKTEQIKVFELMFVVVSAIRSFVTGQSKAILPYRETGCENVIRYVNGMSDFKINLNITFQILIFTPNNTKITFQSYFPHHIPDNLLHISLQILSSTHCP